MAGTARPHVTRKDIDLIARELATDRQSVLYTPLREALLAAAATLDGLASGPPISHSQTTELPLAQKHVSRFRRWLNDAALRAQVAGDVEKAEAFDRIRDL
jgi:hypothetical protein